MASSDGIDITSNHMVPKHEVLSKEEQEKLISHFAGQKILRENLPKIKVTDPQIKGKAKLGDIVKITRKFPITNVYYRLVVKD